ncbi:MAG: nucleotide sugar dehydrogenase [Chloroflexi bacterium]|nr:MAG: nucleotide sugar dehydrogenase [Chloroflexota bacterium]
MRVSVFGLGYVGCVTAACLAKAGHDVIGVDANPEKVAMIDAGGSPVVEPGLGEVLAEVVAAGRLHGTLSGEKAVQSSDVALICVGTPSKSTGQLDVRAVAQVGWEIGHALRERTGPYTVVLRSTVLPGTTERVLVPGLRAGAGRDLSTSLQVAVNPEFMREGSSLRDFAQPPLTLVGCDDSTTASVLRALYADVGAPFVHTAVKTAEMVKYVSNAFHALKVCFANEIGDVCEALGADAQEVMRIFLMDRKLNVSEAYLRPGFAFGGSCLPKDLRALVHAARTVDVPLALLSEVLPSNEGQIRRAVEAVLGTRKRRIGVVGLAFKAGTDDLRESPMVALVEMLIGKGCDVRVFDPNVAIARLIGANRRYIEEEIPHIASLICADVQALVTHAEVLVIGNASDETERVLAAAGPQHVVIDLTRGAVRRSPASPEKSGPPADAPGRAGPRLPPLLREERGTVPRAGASQVDTDGGAAEAVRGIRVREARPDDYEAVQECMGQVYRETAGLKTAVFDRTLWEWQYFHNELPSMIVVAEAEDRICGYYHVLRFRMRVRGRPAIAAMVQDVGTLSGYRRQGAFRAMGGLALERLRAEGIDFIYTFPNARSLPSFVRDHRYDVVTPVPVYLAPLDLGGLLASRIHLGMPGRWLGRLLTPLARALTLHAPALERADGVIRVGPVDARLEPLMRDLARGRDVSLERDLRYFHWRFFDKPTGDYKVWALERGGRFSAYVVTRGAVLFDARCTILMDFGCLPGEEEALRRLIRTRLADDAREGAVLGVTMGLHSQLGKLGFLRVPDRLNPRPFNLLVRGLARGGPELLDGSAWHITLADWDVL